MARFKKGYKARREERCSSSTLSDSSGSTPDQSIASSPPRDTNDMTRNAQYEEPREAQLELDGVEDLILFMKQVETGGAEEFLDTSHLKIIIDSSNFGDWEDDTWCFFLATFKPLSQRVNHLTIIIRGNVLFTRNNYVKPLVHAAEEVVPGNKGKNVDLGLGPPYSYHDDDFGEGPSKGPSKGTTKKSKFTRSSANSKATAKAAALLNSASPPSTSHSTEGKYAVKKLPSHKVNFHIYEKAIVKDLIEVFSNRSPPIEYITIQGPIELSLRRHIISSINPEYLHSPILSAEAGYAPADAARVAEVAAWESSLPEFRHLGDGVQDPEDFREWHKTEMDDVNLHGLGEWVVPGGKGGRGVWGWRVNVARLFRGLVDGWPGRDD